ncbi:signal recognition particle-docking protein FtsY [Oleiphilus messinensis]|uniref:Signal recognition particle receptor FtsY n=1 Tax=Oleiphilus messinensis TaxID=141451 RepID=A0A1Y0I2L3_9GAMM|nr:signal recognition particle-docking protein FtsY [Oleiphilus messinensis]ARU54449.1 signal recognition particle-docking protein FtsY [Oleiphilus messinensis]
MQAIEMAFIALLGLFVLLFAVDMIRAARSRPMPRAFAQSKVSIVFVDKQKTEDGATEDAAAEVIELKPQDSQVPETVEKTLEEGVSLFARMKQGLSKTRANLSDNLTSLFLGAKSIDDDLLEEIETLLLTADVGMEATSDIIKVITEKLDRNQLTDAEMLYDLLKEELAGLLTASQAPLQLETERKPFVILVVGVNGVGKTTTIGKLAKRFQQEGKSVMLAAGDTFRAAAVEQLQVWGERNAVPVVAQHTGADSASVIYDAIESASAKGVDIVIADTAGRLQNKDNLMAELEKVVRVMRKFDPSAPHEVMLVLDAGTGQNALSQAELFRQAVGVSGITLTKLDGTAKGGIIFAIAKQQNLPIRFVGVGEQIDDLRAFDANEFVDALFAR